MQFLQTIIQFPEIPLQTRDGHKLRGYFGNLFKEHSPLLHNHFQDGSSKYAYPLVQYKVIDHRPMLVGLNQGGELLTSLFLKIKELKINGIRYEIYSKNIRRKNYDFDNFDDLNTYRFMTLWMGLNQRNILFYEKSTEEERHKLLNKILTANILSFCKGIGVHVENKILLKTGVSEKMTNFKNIKMLAFEGKFTTNAPLPDHIGLGKAVSRGFGTICRQREA